MKWETIKRWRTGVMLSCSFQCYFALQYHKCIAGSVIDTTQAWILALKLGFRDNLYAKSPLRVKYDLEVFSKPRYNLQWIIRLLILTITLIYIVCYRVTNKNKPDWTFKISSAIKIKPPSSITLLCSFVF